MSSLPEEDSHLELPKRDSDLESKSDGTPINGSASSPTSRAHITTAMTFQGPLPPPHILRAYNQIVPNGAERIFSSFEKQVVHRQHLERTVVEGNNRRADRGFWAALFLASLVILGGFWFAYLGKSLEGLAAIVLALASLVAVFIIGRAKQSEELTAKASESEEK